jgi:hypothetical protein
VGGKLAIAIASAVLLGFAAPVAAAPPGSWLPGDLHVHTCYSHDAYCGPTDDNTGPDTFYSSGGSVKERFLESSGKGLAFLAITDHDDIRAQSDPDYGSHGVVPIAAYEASLSGGHAQMLGATKPYAEGTGDAAATNAMANALRADGGVFQANHPSYRQGAPVTSCSQLELSNRESNPMHWRYGFDVRPDTIEVWNATSLIPPSELFWECWLQRGARIGATAGSDSHGANTLNIGFPTTWVFARSTRPVDILAALRAGRTTLSRVAPRQGAVRLVLEGDRNRDGTYESTIGDQVPPATPMRVRAEGSPGRGLVRVRANGRTLVDGADLRPGGEVRFDAPGDPVGWVRATLYLQDGTDAVDPSCGPGFPTGEAIDFCSKDLATAAMTSPIWIGRPAPPPKPRPHGGTPHTVPDSQEPDRQPPLSPGQQQGGEASPPPDVPPQRERGARVRRLRVAWDHDSDADRPRVLIHWQADGGPFRVQAKRKDEAWRTLRKSTDKRGVTVRLPRGRWSFRVRSIPPFGRPGPWATVHAQI